MPQPSAVRQWPVEEATMPHKILPPLQRLHAKTVIDSINGCWLWTGATVRQGSYGQIYIDGKLELVHRASWRIHFGPIPDGMDVCHECDVRNCWRPGHLFVGTRLDNMRDASMKGRMQRAVCVNGHPRVPETMRWYGPNSGMKCRVCHLSYERRKKAGLVTPRWRTKP